MTLAPISVSFLLVLSMASPAVKADPSGLCLDAARAAAETTGVPIDVLLAISLVETGQGNRPWPWTVNLGGEGHWLESRQAAEELVQSTLQDGLTNIDIGCFQLNLRWHSREFASLSDMLDPVTNATYAAWYLAEKYAETGDWSLAAAAYHSSTPAHAERYRARFETELAKIAGQEGPPVLTDRPNGFPLLMAGRFGSKGSLVPDTAAGPPLVVGP